ncbi:beta-galactosidase [Loigolactobacillus jiayinensis]|uniref:Beta-galactosidase n=1 Tax=Loigolactobacillus jiayinensis TaxID=2486016 RepID=A0ABW1RAE2_9LACO|nr:beta-galactosidase [Loigolactobacillus jiayinensis]
MVKTNFGQILFGGDYNPEQWPKEIWYQDMQLLTEAKINEATINVFSWAQVQPSEERYDFTVLDQIIDLLVKNKFKIILATATAALPAWLATRYPDVNRTDFEGRQHRFSSRHNACPNSPHFRYYSHKLAAQLAARYGKLANVICWHVANEYGGQCYCDNCAKAFRVWLRQHYASLAQLNQAWNTNFWSHTFTDWDQIVPPNALGDAIGQEKATLAGLSIDYRRFMSDSILQNFKDERDAIRQFDAATPITTNLMGTFKDLDYFKWAREMDLVSWDNYPAYNTPLSFTAMSHDLMRGLKGGQPFMLMEQTPSQQNWQPYNSLKKPGQMRALSYQALAHGADTVQFFQLRQSRGATEKFHGAVISHVNTDKTRVFQETKALGQELQQLGDCFLGARVPAKVAIIFDWDNYWALEYASGPNVRLKYVAQIHQYYAAFYRRNIAVDFIPTELSAAELKKYDLVVAPVLYMLHPGVADNLKAYVKTGGHLLTTFMSGIADEHDNIFFGGYPGPLRDLLGIWVEEFDALPPEQQQSLHFAQGPTGSGSMICDVMHLEGAQALATYGAGNFYADTPVITNNRYGSGQAYYVGTQLDTKSLDYLVKTISNQFNWEQFAAPSTVEITRRDQTDYAYYFILNNGEQAENLIWQKAGVDLLTQQDITPGEIDLPAFAVKIIRCQK